MTAPRHQVISRDAERALEEFSEEFRNALALAPAEPWAAELGYAHTSDAPRITWPVPLSATGYQEFKGDPKYRQLFHRSISMVSKNWQDGVEALAEVVEAPDFIGWTEEPTRMAEEWARHRNVMVADMLASASYDGPLLDWYRDEENGTPSNKRLFAAGHPFNVFNTSLGTFTNYTTCTAEDILSGKIFDDADGHFAGIKGANGRPLGLRVSAVLAPTSRRMLFRRALEKELLITAIKGTGGSNVGAVMDQNMHLGTRVLFADELHSDDYFYIVAQRTGLYPFVTSVGTPEELIFDKSSEFYKNTLKVRYGVVGKANAAAVLPHCILRVQITGGGGGS